MPDPKENTNGEILEHILVNNDEKSAETNKLLETIIEQNADNNVEPLLEASLELQDKKGSEIKEAINILAEKLNPKEIEDGASFIIKGVKGDKGDTPEKGKDYYTPDEIKVIASEIEAKIRIPEDGYTPIKGTDYFTDLEVKEIISQVKSLIPDPKDGKDGLDADVDYEMIITEVLSKVKLPKDGKPGKNGKTYTSEEILKLLKGKIDYEDIKNTPTIFKGMAGQGYLKDLADVGDISDGQGIKRSGAKFIGYDSTDSDEKIKYDVSDPVAGYLGAKVVAGLGITVSEGTGADENKVKITNSYPFIDAPSDGTIYGRRNGDWERFTLIPPIEEWWDPTGGLPVAPADGDRYVSDGTGNGWTDGYIYEWDDTAGVWVESVPEEGWMFWEIFGLIMWVFFSGGWMEIGSDSFVKLDQTIPQTMTGLSDGFLTLSGGVITADTNTYIIGSGINKITVGTVEPSTPTTGDLWIDTN